MKRNATNWLRTIIVVLGVLMYICLTYVQYKVEGADVNLPNEIYTIVFANIRAFYIAPRICKAVNCPIDPGKVIW